MITAHYLYYNDNSPVQFGSKTKLLNFVKKNIKDKNKSERLKKQIEILSLEFALGTHFNKKIKNIGQYHYNLIPYKNGLFETDLMFMNVKPKLNKNYKIVLLLLNAQTKFLRYAFLKNKSANEVKRQFRKLMETIPKRNYTLLLHADNGREFYNSVMNNVYKKENIHLYSSNSPFKASMVERVIKTLRDPIVKAMEGKKTEKWIDIVPNVIKNYNNQTQSTILMSPNEGEQSFSKVLWQLALKNSKKNKDCKVFNNFKKGDVVRVKARKRTFRKDALSKNTVEVFEIFWKKMLQSKAVYKLRNIYTNKIEKGTFDDNDLILAKKENIYNFTILKKRVKEGKKQYFVHWDGFDNSYNEWINANKVIK